MRILVTLLLAALIVADVSAGAGPTAGFRIIQVGQTGRTVTFAWKPQRGAVGYQFLRNGTIVARTLDPSATKVTFWKAHRYAVQVLRRDSRGRLGTGNRATITAKAARPSTQRGSQRLTIVPARKVAFKLRLTHETRRTVTFSWKPQPGVDGYRFVRNGVVVSTTFDESLTSATFWKGKRYAVDALRMTPGKRVRFSERTVAYRLPAGSPSRFMIKSAPRVEFRLRVGAQTPSTITFRWKRQPGIDGYRFLRNGRVISQTFNRATTSATFWKGSRYAVQAFRVTADKKTVGVMRTLALTPGSSRANGRGSASPVASSPGAAPPPASPAPAPPSGKPSSPPSSGGGSSAPATPAPAIPAPPAPRPTAPTPPSVGPGGTLTLTGSYSPSAFFAAVALAPSGAVTVRGGFTITGSIDVTRPALRIEAAHINGEITFSPSSTGSSLVNSSADGFSIVGADDILIEGSTFDGQCRVAQNWIQPAGGDGVRRFVIRGNTLRNYHICSDESVHSEAIFVAALSQGGLIEGNTFTDNGTTGHLFFSWFGGDPGSDYPRDICVRGNSFTRSLNAYYHIQFRQEIPSSANIDIDPSNVVGPSIGSHATSLTSAFERPCD